MSDMFIWPYKSASESATALAKELGINKVKRQGTSVRDKKDRIIINWGSSDCPFTIAKVLNKPDKVAIAADKLRFFQAIDRYNKIGLTQTRFITSVNIPEWSTQYRQALLWIQAGYRVCARTILNGNNGAGLIITNQANELPTDAPLYTVYIPKTHEFRVHVIDGTVVEVQKKVWPKSKSSEGVDFSQRNFSDGFVFQSAKYREVHPEVIRQALNAVKALELDFAGVDVIWNGEKAAVLEVNTAPGIDGSDLTLYANSFKDIQKRIG